MNIVNTVVLIPSLNPDNSLIKLISRLRELAIKNIVVVNDGSSISHLHIFDTVAREYGCTVISHETNKGKGAALKTGIDFIYQSYPPDTGIVTADADGQHSPENIVHITEVLSQNPDRLILGIRDFNQNNVPFKSKFGNKITSAVFRLTTGQKCSDTQTGLRGMSLKYRDRLMKIYGDRFEYEINMLIEFARDGIKFIEIPIETIYSNSNRETHFRAVKDSALIYGQILKFTISSVLSFVVDILLFKLLISGVFFKSAYSAFYSTVGARLVSGVFNYTFNKNVVFRNTDRKTESFVKYLILFCVQMFLSSILVSIIQNMKIIDVTAGKAIIDTFLFIFSYIVQRTVVFARSKNSKNEERVKNQR